jgi:hypothetical protein
VKFDCIVNRVPLADLFDKKEARRVVFGSPVRSGLLAVFGKTETETGLPNLEIYSRPD